MTPLVFRALERELLVWRRTWRGSVFTAFVQPLLFLGAMGLGLGGLVDERTTGVGGLRYVEFVAPGLLVASAMLSVAGDALWGVMAGVKWMGQFRSMVHTAVAPGDVFAGRAMAAGVRAGVAAAAFLFVAALLGGVTSWWAPLAVPIAVLLAVMTSAVLSSYSVGREGDQTFSLIMRLGIIPLFLFSGTFFPVSQLPDGIEPLAWLSPLWHAAEAARMATAGGIEPVILVHIGVLVAITAAVTPIGIRAFEKRLTA